ncbi:outer membrane protein assembly factor BamA [Phenylobacterium sp.]|jgi:outer membrane protein insertion porin family|uniref:outer membrane protein assembly factor BamA n=1 Tax=Phenylobacterium sp. TaxID=1871053 RepID=UPI0037C8027A
MFQTRASRAALVSGLALLLGSAAVVAPGMAFAQAERAGVIQRILVQGNERIEQSTVVSYLPVAPGEPVDAARIDLALKALFRTDLFSDVKIDFRNGDLIVTVVENPIINRVIFEGNKGLKEDKLRDEVTVRPRGIFTRSKVQGDVQRIVELYRRSGRISANVTPQIIELPQKRVDLIFKIEEGPKSGILSVNILGNKAFSDNDLRDVVVTEETRWFKFFSNNANYDPDRLEYDKEQLRKHYRNRGYYDFRVTSAVAELAPDKNGFVITYTVDEGPRYRFGKVEVETELQKLDKTVLESLLVVRSGQVYQDEQIEQATDALTFAAGAAGFAFVDVRPRYTPDRDKGVVDVTFSVREGPRVYVDRIDIVGNNQTLDYVIRREMSVVEGDAYNRALVDRSKRQIRSLGFFKEVDITEVPGTSPDRTSLQVKIEEQPTGELSFSAGYSSVDQLVLDLGITQRNFRGRGQDVRARVSVGSLRQQLDFSFTEPRFLSRDVAAGVDVYGYRYDLSEFSSYKTTTFGTTFRANFPLGIDSRGAVRYTLRQDDIQIDGLLCDPSQGVVLSASLCEQVGKRITSLVGYGGRLDRRNDYLNPTRGYYVDINQDLAGLGGDVSFLRTDLEAGWFYGITKDFIFSAVGSAGYVVGWGGDNVRINDRYYKGGLNFRGFETAGIGPRDLSLQRADALGGKAFAIGTVELTVPTFLPEQYGIKAAVFSDFGTLGLLDKADRNYRVGDLDCLNPQVIDPSDPTRTINNPAIPGTRNACIRDDLSLRASAGVSIFWKSPMGPIRFDFSRVLAQEIYDRKETFRFSTSTRF